MDDAADQETSNRWPGLPGRVHGTFHDGFFEWWAAHDGGLFHSVLTVQNPDAPTKEQTQRYVSELILWHDVRDVEVSTEFTRYPGGSVQEWSILVQYPRIKATRSEPEFRDFAIAVARLAAANH